MNKIKTRNTLVLVHLWLAGLLAPVFLVVGITGALDLIGVDAETHETPIPLAAGTHIDPDSATIEQDIAQILSQNGIATNFESLRVRDDQITTRPTSQSFVRFKRNKEGWSATLLQPDLQYSLMELHKGHGPSWFRIYEILSGIALLVVVIGGIAVGIMTKPYRRKTIIACASGATAFFILGYAL